MCIDKKHWLLKTWRWWTLSGPFSELLYKTIPTFKHGLWIARRNLSSIRGWVFIWNVTLLECFFQLWGHCHIFVSLGYWRVSKEISHQIDDIYRTFYLERVGHPAAPVGQQWIHIKARSYQVLQQLWCFCFTPDAWRKQQVVFVLHCICLYANSNEQWYICVLRQS